MARQLIKVVITRTDGTRSESTIKSPHVTDLMLAVADELIYAMTHNKRFVPKPLKKSVKPVKKGVKSLKDMTGIHAMVEGNRDG